MSIKEFIIEVYNTCNNPVFFFSFVTCMIVFKITSYICDAIYKSIKNYIYISEKEKRDQMK